VGAAPGTPHRHVHPAQAFGHLVERPREVSLAPGAIIHRPRLDLETGLAEGPDRARHVIGRTDQQPALARAELAVACKLLLEEPGVLVCVPRLVLENETIRRHAERGEQRLRALGLGAGLIENA